MCVYVGGRIVIQKALKLRNHGMNFCFYNFFGYLHIFFFQELFLKNSYFVINIENVCLKNVYFLNII